MTTDKDRYRALTAAAVLVVAAIAAVVSYLHIAKLALTYGQEPVAAYLLPLSIDGVVATSSLVMLRAARAGYRRRGWRVPGWGCLSLRRSRPISRPGWATAGMAPC